jgi:hypothetical protein
MVLTWKLQASGLDGVYGCRMTGGGFGGYVAAYILSFLTCIEPMREKLQNLTIRDVWKQRGRIILILEEHHTVLCPDNFLLIFVFASVFEILTCVTDMTGVWCLLWHLTAWQRWDECKHLVPRGWGTNCPHQYNGCFSFWKQKNFQVSCNAFYLPATAYGVWRSMCRHSAIFFHVVDISTHVYLMVTAVDSDALNLLAFLCSVVACPVHHRFSLRVLFCLFLGLRRSCSKRIFE